MQFVVKQTNELSQDEKKQICDLFFDVFKKEKSIRIFESEYYNSVLGYSYHALIINDENIIVGNNAFVPFYYNYFDSKVLFCISIDTMVSKQYRDFANLYDMVTEAYRFLEEKNVAFIMGFPNDMAYPVFKKSGLYNDIGELDTYILPYKIGSVIKTLKPLNTFSILISKLFISLGNALPTSSKKFYPISKNMSTFNMNRYKWFEENYEIVKSYNIEFVYKIIEYEGIKTAFIIDVYELTRSNIDFAAKFIIDNHKNDFDIILYIGKLPFNPFSFIRVPKKYRPKNFNFTGHILNKKIIDNRIFELRNWNINLSNYDLV